MSGEFAVWELEVKDGQVTRLAIDFTQRSRDGKPPLKGTVRVNSAFE